MKMKLKSISFEEFKEQIEEFVSENFTTDELCPRCSDNCCPIIPDDYKGSYEKALKKLFEGLI